MINFESDVSIKVCIRTCVPKVAETLSAWQSVVAVRDRVPKHDVVVINLNDVVVRSAGDSLSASAWTHKSGSLLTIIAVTSVQRPQTPIVLYGSNQVQFPDGQSVFGRKESTASTEPKLYRPRYRAENISASGSL